MTTPPSSLKVKALSKLFTDELNGICGRDTFHENWTPIELAEQICNKIDEITDWSGKICIFYCCSLFRSVVKRVIKLHGIEHALKNVWFVASNMEKIEYCQTMFGLNSNFENFKYIPNENPNDKIQDHLRKTLFMTSKKENDVIFDIVLGNPPYDKGKHKQLYVNFIEKSFSIVKDNGFVCLITPKTWLKQSKLFNRFIEEFHVQYLNIDKCASYFPNIGTSFSYFVAQKMSVQNNPQNTVLECTYPDIKIINLSDYSDLTDTRIIFDPDFIKLMSIFDKLFLNGTIIPFNGVGDFNGILSPIKDEIHIYPCFLSSKEDRQNVFSSTPGNHYSLLKLAVAHIMEPGRSERFSKITTDCIGRYSRYFLGSETELLNIQMFFNSSIYFFINLIKRNGRYAYLNIPRIDFSRSWTDIELYEYFNLTQEEINLIESTI